MRATIAGLVTPHVMRVIDLAHQAEKGMNVDWHVRGAVTQTMHELRDQYNAAALVAAYIEGLETAARQAAGTRVAYVRVLRAAPPLRAISSALERRTKQPRSPG